ncbi:UDP-glucuronosyltransferase 2B15-like isoform X1 [Clarias gariepinus]|uniref:UDP-glucuronosyltransferase 2B15-like isoform X1 n=1 Tax=Clarias gariepinus TaxID=13013 RepID=UPI00234C3AE2|nr:UDP-glucuronosyltransferase 2B15-like isoform X1 [Clarias gariepinus]
MLLHWTLLTTALMWTQIFHTSAEKILVYPVEGSHWLNMNIILRELHKRGHDLTVLRSSMSLQIPEHAPHYRSLTIQVSQSISLDKSDLIVSILKKTMASRKSKETFFSFMALYQQLMTAMEQSCRESANMLKIILEDKTFIKKLKNFHLFLADPFYGGGVILGSYLGLPIVLNTRWIMNREAHFAVAPSPLSYIPTFGSELSDKMTFTDRLKNLLHYAIGQYIDHMITRPAYQSIISEFIDPNIDIFSLIQGADLWLMRVDFVFEFPRPTMPNVVYIGGFQCKPSSPLPDELEMFMQSSGEHGVIIMSFGTYFKGFELNLSEIFASAFAHLPQKVVWKYAGPKPSTVSNNTLILDWIPQNDLLGHPKTKLFITHGGTNSIYEAIYHGVPMLAIPLILDQFDNTAHLKAKGIAEVLELTDINVDTFTESVKNILDKRKLYMEHICEISSLLHDTPIKPMDSVIFWLEFVMRHKGAAHLRTESYKMPWYAYHNVDILAFILGVFMILFLIFALSCKLLFKALQRKRKVKQQ